MSRVIGITGTIGSGKSAVGEILTSMGIPVIDTDQIVHDLLKDSKQIRNAVIARFGSALVDPAGSIDRVKLGNIVFADAVARKQLESILHPEVLMVCRNLVKALSEHPLIAILVPLLFEAGVAEDYDEVWTVVTDEHILKDRLKTRSKLSDSEIQERLRSQWSQSEKAARAHHVIENSGTTEHTRRQVEDLLQRTQGKSADAEA